MNAFKVTVVTFDSFKVTVTVNVFKVTVVTLDSCNGPCIKCIAFKVTVVTVNLVMIVVMVTVHAFKVTVVTVNLMKITVTVTVKLLKWPEKQGGHVSIATSGITI